MNGFQRIRAALAGTPPDRVPVMLHNFLMAAREAGFTQRRFRNDPAAIAESFIRAVETYGYDGVLVDIDTVTVAEALGVEPGTFAFCRAPAISLDSDRRTG